MKRVWKPLDAGGLRLYEVNISGPDVRANHKGEWWHESRIVAAKSPSDAAHLIEQCGWREGNPSVIITGQALNVYQPESWWKDGVPCWMCQQREKREG